jgi:hypothetical protein
VSLGFVQPFGLLTLWQLQHCVVIVFVLHYYLSANVVETLAEMEEKSEPERGLSTAG